MEDYIKCKQICIAAIVETMLSTKNNQNILYLVGYPTRRPIGLFLCSISRLF